MQIILNLDKWDERARTGFIRFKIMTDPGGGWFF
jgi:hypothetical protein